MEEDGVHIPSPFPWTLLVMVTVGLVTIYDYFLGEWLHSVFAFIFSPEQVTTESDPIPEPSSSLVAIAKATSPGCIVPEFKSDKECSDYTIERVQSLIELRKANESLTGSIEELKRAKKKLEEDAAMLVPSSGGEGNAPNSQLLQKLRDMESENEVVRADLESAKRMFAEADTVRQNLMAEKVRLESEVEAHKTQLVREKESREAVERGDAEELAKTRQQMMEEMERAQSELNMQKDEVARAKAEASEMIILADKSKQEAEEAVARVTHEKESVTTEQQSLQQILDEKVKKERELTELEESLASRETALSGKESFLNHQATELADKTQQLAEQEQIVSAKASSLEAREKQLEEALDRLNEERETLEAQLEEAHRATQQAAERAAASTVAESAPVDAPRNDVSPVVLGRQTTPQPSPSPAPAHAPEVAPSVENPDPEMALTWSRRGQLFLDQGNTTEAADCFTKAMQFDPWNANFASTAGDLLAKVGNRKDALDAYEAAIRIQPSHVAAVFGKAVLLESDGDLVQAEEWFHRATALDPSMFEAHTKQGIVLKKLNRLEEALKCFERGLKFQAGNVACAEEYVQCLNALGEQKLIEGRIDDAVGMFCTSLSTRPQWPGTSELLSRALDSKGISHPLHWAVQSAPDATILALVDVSPALLKTADDKGRTVLHLACRNSSSSIIQHLVDAGASVNAKDQDGQTSLHVAATRGDPEIAHILCGQSGTDVNCTDGLSRTPLHSAAAYGKLSMVDFLIANGAQAGARDRYDKTPLHLAADHGNDAVVSRLATVMGSSAGANGVGTNNNSHISNGNSNASSYLSASHHSIDESVESIHDYRRGLSTSMYNPSTGAPHTPSSALAHVNNQLSTSLSGIDGYSPRIGGGTGSVPQSPYRPGSILSEVEKIMRSAGLSPPGRDRMVARIERSMASPRESPLPSPRYGAGGPGGAAGGPQSPERGVLTAVQAAVKTGDINLLSTLIAAGADLNGRDANGRTPLHSAAEGGLGSMVHKLVQEGGDPNVKDTAGQAPLHIAVMNEFGNAVQKLVELGAHVNATDYQGKTPLHIAASMGLRKSSSRLVELGADVDKRDMSGKTPSHLAIMNAHRSVVLLMFQKGADFDVEDSGGNSVFTYADQEMLSLLVENGLDVNKPDKEGKTILHRVAERGYAGLVTSIVLQSSNVNARDCNGHTPLHDACLNPNIDVVRSLLESGANMKERTNDGRTALHFVTTDVEVVKYLVSNGCDVNAKADDGMTPLHRVAQSYDSKDGHVSVASYLISAGAEMDVTDNVHKTPLHYATMQGFYGGKKIAVLLIQSGARLLPDADGKDPLHYAELHVGPRFEAFLRRMCAMNSSR